jgi:predicted SAM-dependent methyltransferase
MAPASRRRSVKDTLRPLVRRVNRGAARHGYRAVRALMFEFASAVHHAGALRRARRIDAVRLELGSGPRVKPGWVNIDFAPNADLRLDLRRPLPFADESVELIHSEHTLEHLSEEDGLRLLRECERVMKPTARLSIGVPDHGRLLHDYARGHGDLLDFFGLINPGGTPMEQVNAALRQAGQHLYSYDAETLLKRLDQVGLEGRVREFDPELDSREREPETLYVEAIKPAAQRPRRERLPDPELISRSRG